MNILNNLRTHLSQKEISLIVGTRQAGKTTLILLGALAISALILMAFAKITSGAPANKDSGITACKYKGEMNVTEGTNAGLTLRGMFHVVHDPNSNRIGGDLHVQGRPLEEHEGKLSKHLEMSGTVESGKVTMEFTLPNREDKMVGTGDFPSEAKQCKSKSVIEGDLKGPADDDKGDWIFTIIKLVKLGAPYACFAGCSYAGGTDAECDAQCGTTH